MITRVPTWPVLPVVCSQGSPTALAVHRAGRAEHVGPSAPDDRISDVSVHKELNTRWGRRARAREHTAGSTRANRMTWDRQQEARPCALRSALEIHRILDVCTHSNLSEAATRTSVQTALQHCSGGDGGSSGKHLGAQSLQRPATTSGIGSPQGKDTVDGRTGPEGGGPEVRVLQKQCHGCPPNLTLNSGQACS